MEELLIFIIIIFSLIIARLVHLYGRSAYEAGEYGGDFIPLGLGSLFGGGWISPYIVKIKPCKTERIKTNRTNRKMIGP